MRKKEFSKESVDRIYAFAKETGYNEGFSAGYKQCKIDIEKLFQ